MRPGIGPERLQVRRLDGFYYIRVRVPVRSDVAAERQDGVPMHEVVEPRRGITRIEETVSTPVVRDVEDVDLRR